MIFRNDFYRKLHADPSDPGSTPSDPPADPAPSDPPADPAPSDPPADPPAAATAWPEDWRLKMAGGDEKVAAQLERFVDPAAVGKSFMEARGRISAGDLLKPLAEDASEDDIKAYREQQGIPEEPSGYLENIEGLVIGEDEKDLFEGYAKAMHEANVPPQHVEAGLRWYNSLKDAEAMEVAQIDQQDKQEYEETMRQEWGTDYQKNHNIVNAIIDAHADEKTAVLFRNARTQEGRAFFNDPGVIRMMASMAREINPAMTILPPGQADMNSLQERKSEIEKFMRTNRSEYFKDQKMQDEYREILEAEEKLAARQA